MTGTPLKLRGDTRANLLATVLLARELGIDTTNYRPYLGDGSTAGGRAVAMLSDVPVAASFANRIRNGAMRVDQRRAGASVAVTGQTLVALDGWRVGASGTGSLTAQRQPVTVFTGLDEMFANSLKLTVGTAHASPAAGDVYALSQFLEGYDIADLAYGTSLAKTLYVRFRVKSSVTGNFNAALREYGGTRSYLIPFTIAVANQWTVVTAAVPGDTAGTWGTGNAGGMIFGINLGSGSTFQNATTSAWLSGNYIASSASVKLIATLNATMEISGVEMRVDGSAAPFARVSLTDDLLRCQRYFQKSYETDTAWASVTDLGSVRFLAPFSITSDQISVPLQPPMRIGSSPPVIHPWSTVTGQQDMVRSTGGAVDVAATIAAASARGFSVNWAALSGVGYRFHWTAVDFDGF